MTYEEAKMQIQAIPEKIWDQLSKPDREAMDMAFSALQAQADGDCISRQAAIDALDKRFDKIPMGQTTEILMLRKDLRELPSIQPEVNCSEFPNSSDTIYRQAAIDALKRAEALTRAFGYHNVIETIRDLPSAQPEIIHCKDCKHRYVEDMI